MSTVLLCHDDKNFASGTSDCLRVYGHKVLEFNEPRDALLYIESGQPYDGLVVHKDYGALVPYEHRRRNEGVTSEKIIEESHKLNLWARTILISGEYPEGSEDALSWKVDGYIPANGFSETWLDVVLNRGVLSQEEMNRRGKSLETPSSAYSSESKFLRERSIHRYSSPEGD